jgi:hypothetical protein
VEARTADAKLRHFSRRDQVGHTQNARHSHAVAGTHSIAPFFWAELRR